MEPPAVEVIEGQLIAGTGALAAHDETQPAAIIIGAADLDGGLGDLGSFLGFGVERRDPPGGRVGRQGQHRGPYVGAGR